MSHHIDGFFYFFCDIIDTSYKEGDAYDNN